MTTPAVYGIRGEAEPHKSSAYNAFLSFLPPLEMTDLSFFKERGLTSEHINIAGYKTKKNIKSKEMNDAIAHLANTTSLDNVPGFFINDKTGGWSCTAVYGPIIPVRDIRGNIASLLIRNVQARMNEKTGRVDNKYVQFSSSGKTKGSRAYQTTHCPIVRGPALEVAGEVIRITEGVLKADVATALDPRIYTIGLQGLNVKEDCAVVLEMLEAQVVHVALDAGEDDAPDMIKAKAKIIMMLREKGYHYKIEVWEKRYGKGIDDVLKSGNYDKVTFMSEDEIEAFLEKAKVKDPNNGDWFYVVGQESFYNIKTGQILNKSQFADKFQLETSSEVNKRIASGFPQVDSLTFWPGQGVVLKENDLECLNLWVDPEVEPSAGPIDVFLDHINYLFPEETVEGTLQANILLDFISFCVQNPGKKIRWANIIHGKEGVGKSFLSKAMKKMLGERNISTPMMERVHDKFTDWQGSCQLVIIDEWMSQGKLELMNKMKPFITEEETEVRGMWAKAYKHPNRYNIIGYTNYENPIIIKDDDRRYCILRTSSDPQGKEYYTKLFNWLDERANIQALLSFFISRDLSQFNENYAPMTLAKQDVITLSKTGLEEWIDLMVNDEAWPFNSRFITIRHLKSCDKIPMKFRQMSNQQWNAALKSSGCMQLDMRVRLSDGSRVTPWLINKNDSIALNNMTPEQVAIFLEKASLTQEPGGLINPVEDTAPI